MLIYVFGIFEYEAKIMVKSKLTRYTHSNQFAIKIIFPNNDKYNMWESIIEHCSRDLSNNELRQVWKDCNDQLLSMNQDDIPLTFKEMMKELSQVMVNRKLWKKNKKLTERDG